MYVASRRIVANFNIYSLFTTLYSTMYKFFMSMAVIAALLTSCGGSDNKESGYPKNFNSIGDEGRVDYIIRHASPDSLARFIVYGAIGRDKNARIDTLAIAQNHAYEKLSPEDTETFSAAYDELVGSLPLGDKMKIYRLDGSEDPMTVGYKLGLEYATTIRERNMKSAEIEKELSDFRNVCGADTATYRRFMTGFNTVLKIDNGKDIPVEIYQKYGS